MLTKAAMPYEVTLKDGFLRRILRRGLSDQTCAPKDAHERAADELLAQFRQKYGEDFDQTLYHGAEDDLLITIYRK